MNRKKIRGLSDKIVSTFGISNVVCTLLHGSILFNPNTPPQDVDLIIILRNRNVQDCSRLRQLVSQLGVSRLLIHLHLIYLDEIPLNADFFSVHTCGAFFVCHLRQAEVLYGENVFDKMVGPSDYQLQLSLLQKVQQYTFQLRNLVFKTGQWRENELQWARKKSFVVLKDLVLSTGVLLQKEEQIVEKVISSFQEFSTEEVDFLEELLRPLIKSRSEDQGRRFMTSCLLIHERAYGIMRMRVGKKLRCQFLG